MKFVLDSSVALSWVLGDRKTADTVYAHRVLEALKSTDVSALVPVIWPLEITNVITKAESRNALSELQTSAFLELLAELDLDCDTGAPDKVFTDALQLARRYRLSSYDASYLDLALKQSLPLATLDAELLRAAKKAGVKRFS